MNNPLSQHPNGVPPSFLAGDGEMGRLIRSTDWSKTPLGPIESWPQSLRSAVSILLPSKAQIAMFWGSELITLYNDAYRPVLGTKHPRALGLPIRETWSELWGAGLRELFEGVLATGEAFWASDRPFFMERYGFTEETFFDISYDPIRDESGRVGGLFCIVSDTTARVVGGRRLQTLRDLSASVTAGVKSVEEACRSAAEVLHRNQHDLPFALIYLVDSSGHLARLVGASGLKEGSQTAPSRCDLTTADPQGAAWPLQTVLRANRRHEVTGITSQFGVLPGGVWPEPPNTAVVLPISTPGQDRPTGFLVAGVSPRRPLDDAYRGFFDLLANQIATIVANARAYEEEKQRAEALAELDRAKTAFFSNVSHEFRTPLTLILGPIEDALADDGDQPTPRLQERLEVAHRNGLRLQRLVNTLLDFSRIEAGRAQASYEPTDLAAVTMELASNFRSACERAGLELVVDCPPLPEPVYVDREMWEKVVLNLLSNAFKYTLTGRIEVALHPVRSAVELTVRDTGSGIPAEEMPKLFERFHRVEGARGRTQEGTGIGLALVRELARLHGGDVRAESEHGKGSVFQVTIPLGIAHLPADRIRASRTLTSTALGAAPFVEEALRWLPDQTEGLLERETGRCVGDISPAPGHTAESSGSRPRILLADDNADMREYVRRLLTGKYEVVAVADGSEALGAARELAPELVLADVMMPGLDGFGLLREMRADPHTRQIPVLLLSARAGEEARVEGMAAGADDYLTKPFSARELLARVSAHLELARVRRDVGERLRASEEKFRSLCACSPVGIFTTDMLGLCTYTNPRCQAICGFTAEEALGEGWSSFVHPEDQARVFNEWSEAARAGREYSGEFRWLHRNGAICWSHVRTAPMLSDSAALMGHVGTVEDITERRQTEEQLRESEKKFRATFDRAAAGVAHVGPDNRTLWINPGLCEMLGYTEAEMREKTFIELTHPDDRRADLEQGQRLLKGEIPSYRIEKRYIHKSGRVVWGDLAVSLVRHVDGQPRYAVGVVVDITDRKRGEEAAARRSEQVRRLADLATRLNTDPRVSSVISVVTEEARTLIGSHQAVISLILDQDWSQAVNVASLSDKYARWRNNHALPDGNGISSLVCRTNRPMRLSQAELEAHPAHLRSVTPADDRPPLRGWLAAPLVGVDGRNIGLIQLSDKYEDEFTTDDEAILVQLARMASIAIENARLVENLRNADRLKDDFIALLAHELRNPLAPIRNGLQVMRLGADNPDAVAKAWEMMHRQLGHMVRLIDDLLDVSRINRNKMELRRTRVTLADVVASAVETARPLLDAAGHELTVALPVTPVVLDADLTRLAQVLANLLTNSAKYTPLGGRVYLSAERGPGQVVVSVRDTGIGIPADALPTIFDMFSQVNRSIERSTGGLGIGLALVKALVEMHGGTVTAASEGEGRGSTFIVVLPVPEPDPSGLSDTPATNVPRTPARRVLVVDDNRDGAETMAEMLRLLGHKVRTAHDGIEAVAAAETFQPDLVLMDVGMPRLNGLEATRQIRQQPWGNRMTVIALTGWGQENDRERSRAAGCDGHLVKPVALEDLERVLTGVRGKHR